MRLESLDVLNTIKEGGQRVYSPNNKPSAADVGARPASWKPTWNDVQSKPSQATRWPSWSEVTGKPSGIINQSALDGRYLLKGSKAVDSDKLDGRDSSQFVKLDSKSGSMSTGNWYRIATGTSRSSAEFVITDGVSGMHGYVRFQAGISYGGQPYINVIASNGYNGGNGILRYVRIVDLDTNVTYGKKAIEVFVDGTGSVTTHMTYDIGLHASWNLTDFSTSSGTLKERVKVDLNLTNAFMSTNHMYSGGGRVYSTANKPTSADVGSYSKSESDNKFSLKTQSYSKAETDNKYQLKNSKLDRFNTSLIDTNAGQDLTIRSKRALVGMDTEAKGGLVINYSNDFGKTTIQSDLDVTGEIRTPRVESGYNHGVSNSIGCSNWFRSSGKSGWVNGTYGGGIYMIDSTWLRTYGNKKFHVNNTGTDSIYTSGGVKANKGFFWGGQSLDSRYLGKTAKATDSDKLDGISSEFFAKNNTTSIVNPVGGTRAGSGYGSTTGAIRIVLPQYKSNTMITLKITCYDYTTHESFEIFCGGYNHTGTWINTFAYMHGNNKSIKVRFGRSASKDYIYIGETTSKWSHLQTSITHVTTGYSNYQPEKWNKGWAIDYSITKFEDIKSTIECGRQYTTVFKPSKADVGLSNVPNYTATSSTTDSSTSKFAVAGAVKAVMDKANSAYTLADAAPTKSENDSRYLGKTAKAADADKIDGRDISQLFRREDNAADNSGAKNVMILQQFNNALPSGNFPSGTYKYGGLITLNDENSRLRLYAPHNQGGKSSLYINTGWNVDSKARAWERLLTYTDGDAKYLGKTAKASDADKLDGINSSSFVRSDADDSISGRLYFTKNYTFDKLTDITTAPIHINANISQPSGNQKYVPSFHSNSRLSTGYVQHLSIGHKRNSGWGDAYFAIGGNDGHPTKEWLFGASTGTFNSPGAIYEAGTSLSSKYLGKTAKAADSNLLDGIDSSRIPYGSNDSACTKLADFNNNTKSGFIESNKAKNQPGTNSSWTWGIQTNHTGGGKYGAQFVISQDGKAYFRVQNSSGAGTWRTFYSDNNKPTAADVGALGKTAKAADADKLDGINSSQFLRSDADDSFSRDLISTSRNRGLFGVYDSKKTDQIWSMGTAYRNNSSGADFGNLYGLAYKHTNNKTGGNMAGGHQMVWCTNGKPKAALGDSGVWSSGTVVAASDVYEKGGKLSDRYLGKTSKAVDSSKLEGKTKAQVVAEAISKSFSQTTADSRYFRKGLDITLSKTKAAVTLKSTSTDNANAPVMKFDHGGTVGEIGFDEGMPGFTFKIDDNICLTIDDGTNMTVNGDIFATGNVSAYSDKSLKTNIRSIKNASEKVSKISGNTYERIDLDNKKDVGVIAQEVQQILPEAVIKNNDGILSVNYNAITGLLVEAFKEERLKYKLLEDRLNKLEKLLEE